MAAQRQPLPGHRWHFQHGPIDIVIGADGEPGAVEEAHDAAWRRFATVLDELVSELPQLRRPVSGSCPLRGAVARRMWLACHPYCGEFVTPMAAVAGAVAQELIAFYEKPGISRAWVNNGGDIALHLATGQSLRVGLFADMARYDTHEAMQPLLRTDGDFSVDASLPVRGIATSGWRGRSLSLGIADSVTVLARTAAQADAAATMIANAVDLQDARIERRPASQIKDDSDLGDLLATVNVPALGEAAVRQALRAGHRRARQLQAADLIWSAVIVCQGWTTTTDNAQHLPLAGPDAALVPARPQLLFA
jgi:uncharacterized protein